MSSEYSRKSSEAERMVGSYFHLPSHEGELSFPPTEPKMWMGSLIFNPDNRGCSFHFPIHLESEVGFYCFLPSCEGFILYDSHHPAKWMGYLIFHPDFRGHSAVLPIHAERWWGVRNSLPSKKLGYPISLSHHNADRCLGVVRLSSLASTRGGVIPFPRHPAKLGVSFSFFPVDIYGGSCSRFPSSEQKGGMGFCKPYSRENTGVGHFQFPCLPANLRKAMGVLCNNLPTTKWG